MVELRNSTEPEKLCIRTPEPEKALELLSPYLNPEFIQGLEVRNQTLEDVYVTIIQGNNALSALRWGLIRQQMSVQLRVRTLNLWSLVLFVIQPALFSAVGMLLSRAAGNAMPDLVYSVIGGGIMGMWSGIVFTSTYDIADDRHNGTLEMIVGSPTTLATLQAIRTLTNVLAGLFSLMLAFLAAMLIFGYSLTGGICGAQVSRWCCCCSRMWCIGVFLANFLVWSRISLVRGLPGNADRLPVRLHVPDPRAAGLDADHRRLHPHPLGAGGDE